MANGILLIECADQQGIVSSVTEFIYTNKGNIIELDQYLDHENNHFQRSARLSTPVAPAERGSHEVGKR